MTEPTSENPTTSAQVETESQGTVDPLSNDEPRRFFMKAVIAIGAGAVAVMTPLVAGVLFFLDPLLRRAKGGGNDEFIKLETTVDALPADGTPQRVTVFADRVDAWNKFLHQQVGSVYVRKIGDQVIVFNATCPHLGCGVDYRPTTQDFFCPCHTSAFDLEGQKKNDIPPRAMDVLEAEIRNENEIWVHYQDFRAATAEKIPV